MRVLLLGSFVPILILSAPCAGTTSSGTATTHVNFSSKSCPGGQAKYKDWPQAHVPCPWATSWKTYRPTSADKALIRAASFGRIPELRAALKAGANINARSVTLDAMGRLLEVGSTALGWAADQKRFAAARILLRAGANVNAMGENCLTPLHHAALRRDSRMLKMLIRRGANLDARTSQGQSAIEYAANQRSLPAVKVLVEAGASTRSVDRSCHSVLHNVVQSTDLSIVKYLVRNKAPIDARDAYKQTPLLAAASSNQDRASIIRFLIKSGANLNAREWRGLTALGLALTTPSKANVRILRDLGLRDPGTDSTRR